jgi:hypothetical protein
MTSHSGINKNPLILAAGLELYRRNIFRITGLPVDSTARQITKRAEQLKLAAELGHVQNKAIHELDITPPPTNEQIQEALQRIKEPELRLIDEYFWFWPMHEDGSQKDPAICALQEGKVQTALRIWQEIENDPNHGAIASHNLAVFDHMTAIDCTFCQLTDPTNVDVAIRAGRAWMQSMERWERVATDDTLWEWLENRIRSIDDPRLTTGLVRRMEQGLPQALDKINAEAALRFAESGDIDAARMHIRIMNQSHQGLDDVEAVSEMILNPLQRRIEQRISHAQKVATNDGKSAVQIAQGLLNECIPMMPIFELFHGDSHHKTELFDQVAETANRLGAIYQKTTDRNDGLVALLSHAMTCATGADLKSRIHENIRVIEGNIRFEKVLPAIDAIKNLASKKLDPSERLRQMEQKIIPMAVKLGNERIGDKTLLDLLASTLRDISIEAFNENDDIAIALKAICLAGDHARESQLKQQIAKDRAIVEDRLKRSICVHCCKRTGDSSCEHEFAMHGDVRSENDGVGYGRIRYRSGKFKVPRCLTCWKKHQKARIEGNMTFMLLFGVAIIVGFIVMVNVGFGGFWVIMIGLIIALICKSSISAPDTNANKNALYHPNIRELLSEGWKFGDQPPQN